MQKMIDFKYENTALISRKTIKLFAQQLIPKIFKFKNAIASHTYDSPYAMAFAPFDQQSIDIIQLLAKKKQLLNPKLFLLIGIGGSSLGTQAIYQAIKTQYEQALNNNMQLHCIETLDTDQLQYIIHIVHQALRNHDTILINVITKSGTTIETITNFHIFLTILKQYHPSNYQNYVVITTDKDSVLYKYALLEKYDILTIPQCIGGRYSVFTAVGLFPLACMNINITQLISGAKDAILHTINENWSQNITITNAAIIFAHYLQGNIINNFFFFSLSLESIGKWQRQLIGESLGKEHNIHGYRVTTGITPTISIGSNDLHSVVQLYLGGPNNIFTTFITIQKETTEIIIPNITSLSSQFSHIINKSTSEIMRAITDGTKQAYQDNYKPFCSLIFPIKNEYYIGQFMQFKMLETVLLGHLLEINPFDQPHVELYKKNTRKFLENN